MTPEFLVRFAWAMFILSVVLTVVSLGLTVYCVSFPSGRALSRNLVYLTGVSNAALFFGAVGMAFSALAAIAGARAERSNG